MDRILLTGATGVVGRRVLPLLVAAGHPVSAVSRTPQQAELLRAVGATPLSIDLFDPASVRSAVRGHDVVINLATHMPSSLFRMLLRRSWRENDRIRREGAAILASAAAATGVRRFIQESFAPIHEDGGADWIDERWPVRPAPYNRTMLDAEASVDRYARDWGIGVVLRFAGFYGPDPMLRQMLAGVRKGWAPLPGAPSAYWSSVSHEDAATAVVAALGVPGGVYEICDDEPVTRKEFADVCARAIGAPAPRPIPRWLTRLGGSTVELASRSLRLSNAKLRAASGWAPRWRSVRDGLPEAARQLGFAPAPAVAGAQLRAHG
ncbi:MAG TPA: NAD(P)H-binding protein [Myxococcaceae bacterium]|nr:NAD(P)H-binding protein [Myxococcaceae bacterium]